MEYYQNGGGSTARLHWSYSGQSDTAIPSSALHATPRRSQISCPTATIGSRRGMRPANAWMSTAALARPANGTNVDIWQYIGASNEIWHVTNLGNNIIRLSPTNAPSECLDVTGAGTANGANVEIWQSAGGLNQQWQVIPTDSGYNRLSPMHAPGQCLDVNGAGWSDGTNVQIWQVNGGSNQEWLFQAP